MTTISSILVPVDGSETSRKALEFACDLARRYEALLYLVHVIETPLSTPTLPFGAAVEKIEAKQQQREEAAEALIESAKGIAAASGCAAVETVVAGGSPAEHILERARTHDVDMIVMGSRGLSDIAGLFLGSVSHKVSHLAECTCVTVR